MERERRRRQYRETAEGAANRASPVAAADGCSLDESESPPSVGQTLAAAVRLRACQLRIQNLMMLCSVADPVERAAIESQGQGVH